MCPWSTEDDSAGFAPREGFRIKIRMNFLSPKADLPKVLRDYLKAFGRFNPMKISGIDSRLT
jgi:cytochrome oxidase Cu insertion factor (SCO1/SenC/PrrC family)